MRNPAAQTSISSAIVFHVAATTQRAIRSKRIVRFGGIQQFPAAVKVKVK
jgi:hypothetical protein